MKTFSTIAEISPEHRLEVELPSDIPPGMAEIIVVVNPKGETGSTARERLLALAGSLRNEEAGVFRAAHEDCERVDPNDWR